MTIQELEKHLKELVSIMDNQTAILNSHQETMELISQGAIHIGERINLLEERLRVLEGPIPKPAQGGANEGGETN